MAKKLRVGFDFDGVLVYNPLRVARHPITLFKRTVLHQKKTKFTIPKNRWQKIIWAILHETSIFPSPGFSLARQLIENDAIEAYLISGRFAYLEKSLLSWLNRHGVADKFKSIHINRHDEQPHLFKEKTIKDLDLDVFIEDNFDIVEHLSKNRSKTRVYWVYNILDRLQIYPHKHPHLRAVLEAVIAEFSIKFPKP